MIELFGKISTKKIQTVLFLLFAPTVLFAQETDTGETEEAPIAVEMTEDSEGEPEFAAEEEGAETIPTVEVAAPEEEPAEEEAIRSFDGEKTLKGVKVYENRIYSDALRGIFGNYLASWVIAGDIKKGLGKTVTHEAVVAFMEELRSKDEIESIDFYYTFDAKDRVIIHVILIDNPGFQDFEGTVTLDRIDFYCRNNFFVNRRVLKKTVNLDKKGTYTEDEIKAAIERINGLYVFNDISWGLREEKKDKNGNPVYALQVILSEYGGSKEVRSDELVISDIRFLGNWYTQEWVYTRELGFKVGDTVNVNQLDAAAQRLMNLGVCTFVDWGVIYTSEGDAILVFITRDKLTLLPQFDFAFGSDQLRLGLGFWDKNFIGTKSTINFKFVLVDLMPTFSLAFSVPKIANTYFNYEMSISYDSSNKYTETRKEGDDEVRTKGYREDTVNTYAKVSYSLELPDKNQVMWYQTFAVTLGYDFTQSQNNGDYLGMPAGFATGWLHLAEDFTYDETMIGHGHYMNIDLGYSFNNNRSDGGYRTKGISFAITNTFGFPLELTGYMSRNLEDNSEITEKFYNTIDANFTFHYIPVQWFEFKGYLGTGYTTTDIITRQTYFGSRSLTRWVPYNMQGSGKGFYRGNFDICFTPLIPYVSKVIIIEFDLFGDIGNYGNSYTEMWKETPIWATGIGFNVYVPFLEGFFVSIDLAWGPDNVSGKHGKPKFNFGVSKFY